MIKGQKLIGSLSNLAGNIGGAVPFVYGAVSPVTQPASVNSSSFATGLGTGTVINKPSNAVNGNFLVAFVTMQLGTAITPPAGWSSIATTTGTAGLGGMYFKVASSEPSTYTFSDSASASVNMCVAMIAITTTSISQNTQASTNASSLSGQSGTRTITLGSVTTTQNNCLIIYGAGQVGTTITSNISYIDGTEFQYQQQSQGTAFQTLAVEFKATAGATGTRSATFTKNSGSASSGPSITAAIQIQ